MTEDAILVEGLTKRFDALLAVDGVTFRVPRGSVFGFLGPNGSGKTTTLGMITGLIPPDAGRALVLGRDAVAEPVGALARVGAMIEEPAFYPALSGRRNLQLVARLAGAPRDAVDTTLARVGLAPDAAARRYKGYSQGMKRRLGLAAALVPDPDVLILDEPTNGLDPAGQHEVRDLLRDFASRGRTVLLSSHILHEVQEVCTHAAVLRKGRVVAEGTMSELLHANATGGGGARSRLAIRVDDAARAQQVARQVAGVTGIALAPDGRLLVDAPPELAADVNRALVEAGVRVSALAPEAGAGLEERFFEWTEEARS